jgi:glutathione S-transferase
LRTLDVASSLLCSLTRVASGAWVGALGRRPERLVELYEFEACPFCRKVREALSILDLDAVIYPCPKKGPRFRVHAIERGGKSQFPYLVDPNSGTVGTALYESDDIVKLLFTEYGNGRVPLVLGAGILTDTAVGVAGMWRGLRGARYRPARQPEVLLELWSYEASPYCRIVREVLCALELPYRLHNVARGSRKRADFVERFGRMQVPYLVDPNTGKEMFESADIVSYLEGEYAK